MATALLAIGVVVGTAAPAHAAQVATVEYVDGRVVYRAATGTVVNQVEVSYGHLPLCPYHCYDLALVMEVSGGTILAVGPDCINDSAYEVTCSVLPEDPGIDVFLGAGNDRAAIEGYSGRSTVDGGSGSDILSIDGGESSVVELIGGTGTDTADFSLAPGPVNVSLDDVANDDTSTGLLDNVRSDIENVNGSVYDDVIAGDGDANVLTGGAGNDAFDGGAGGDTISGGSGSGDAVSYATRTVATYVSLDGVANDGSIFEYDNVQVEHVVGGGGNDTIIGNGSANTILGGAGADTLRGGDGDDVLNGQSGYDTAIEGQGGTDTCVRGADGGVVSLTCETVV